MYSLLHQCEGPHYVPGPETPISVSVCIVNMSLFAFDIFLEHLAHVQSASV
jgi:hypothetical protein